MTYEMISQRIHPDDRLAAQELTEQKMREGKGWDTEYRLLMPDGSTKFVFVVTQVATDEAGEVEIMGALMDVTASKQAQARLQASLDEKEALLKEVHHRVKNNLQLISSLLSLQATRIADPAVAELFAESRNRVRSMALVHENLYRAGNFAGIRMRTHIDNLCAHLVRAHGLGSRDVTLSTEIDDIELDLDRAISVGLIVNELVTNSLKHGFAASRAGRLLVVLKRVAPGHCRLTVQDDGIGLPSGFDTERADSLGLQLIHNLALQLQGTIDVKRDCGTTFAIDFHANGGIEVPR